MPDQHPDENGRGSIGGGHPAIHAARVWPDEDGRHVWLSHDCDPPNQKIVTTMLPDTWSADADGNVEPSISCTACGLHFFARLSTDGPR